MATMNRRTMKQATITHLLRLALVALGLATVLAQAHEGPMAPPDAKAAAAKPARKPRAHLAQRRCRCVQEQIGRAHV